mgnify:CR=1 FL=1
MRWTEDSLFAWAKDNRKKLTKDFFSKKEVLQTSEKIAIFMAWSPWAGKTEFIKRLLTKNQESAYYIIDLDEIRNWMPEYQWNHAQKYTRWSIKILEMILDDCISKEYNFIMDGTFSNTKVIDKNISRLIQKWYKIHVFYIHTQPYIAWLYTLLRESDDKRRVPLKNFIQYYKLARENIYLAVEKYSWKVHIHIAHKVRNDDVISFDDTIYDCESVEEIRDIFDKNINFHYNLWDMWISETLFFCLSKAISILPIIWKPLLQRLTKFRHEV